MDETSAYHEAGHALVAVLVGASVRSISIDPDWDDGPERYADIVIEWPAGVLAAEDADRRASQVALAGPVAEMIYSGDPFHPGLVAEWASDWKVAWRAAEKRHSTDVQRLRYLEQMTAQLYRELKHDQTWSAVAAIVDSLLAHEILEGEEVHDIIRFWMQ